MSKTITVTTLDDLGYNHLYGDVSKDRELDIDEDHFDRKMYRKKIKTARTPVPEPIVTESGPETLLPPEGVESCQIP